MRRMVLSSAVIVFGLVTAVMVAGTVLAQPSSTATNNPMQAPASIGVSPRAPQQADCNVPLSHPWVAFYDGRNFALPKICFEGSGLVNLTDYGWANRAQSINVSVNAGCFYDDEFGRGQSSCFKGAFRDNDLSSWNNRIVSFRIN